MCLQSALSAFRCFQYYHYSFPNSLIGLYVPFDDNAYWSPTFEMSALAEGCYHLEEAHEEKYTCRRIDNLEEY